jgi:hypothetical protein
MGDKSTDKGKKRFSIYRLFGYGLIVFGALSILDFFSPIPIPTTGMSAFVTGGLSILGGGLLLITDKGSWSTLIQRAKKTFLSSRVEVDPMIPVKILKLAKTHNGILTASQVAVELNLPLKTAEAGLEECVRYNHAMADYDMKRDFKFYKFQEHLPPEAIEGSSSDISPKS